MHRYHQRRVANRPTPIPTATNRTFQPLVQQSRAMAANIAIRMMKIKRTLIYLLSILLLLSLLLFVANATAPDEWCFDCTYNLSISIIFSTFYFLDI